MPLTPSRGSKRETLMRVEQAADRKACDHDAGDRQAGFAEFEQERGDEGKQSEHAAAFDEHGGVDRRARSDW